MVTVTVPSVLAETGTVWLAGCTTSSALLVLLGGFLWLVSQLQDELYDALLLCFGLRFGPGFL